jgi:hypothetical protein
MTRRREWSIPAAAGLSAATLALSCMGLAGLFPLGAFHVGSFAGGFAVGHDRRAYQVLLGSSSPSALAVGAEESRLALSLSPYDNSARLRLAYVDRLQHRSLSSEGAAQFSRSYDLVPYDHTVAAWRIRFGLENWVALTPEARDAVRREAVAFARANTAALDIRAILRSIRNPNGRLAGALWLRSVGG